MRFRVSVAVLPALFLALAAPVAGQGLQVGPMVGVNFSSLDSDGGLDWSSRTGFLVGAFAKFGLGRVAAIQAEGFFSGQGADLDNVGTVDLHYVNVPVYLRLQLPLPVVKPFLFAGPQLGLRVGCDLEPDTGASTECKDETKAMDWSAIAGLGAELQLGGGVLIGTARYQFGLSEIDDGLAVASSLKQRQVTLTLGYGFGL